MGMPFACSKCQQAYWRRVGKCPACGSWGTVGDAEGRRPPAVEQGGKPTADRRPPTADEDEEEAPRAVLLGEVEEDGVERILTGIGGLDEVLGGEDPGLARGSVVLLGGEPGIGKSTLLLQAAAGLVAAGTGVLYGCGEEMLSQVAARAGRIGCDAAGVEAFALIDQGGDLDAMIAAVDASEAEVVVVDSLQSLSDKNVKGEAGRVTQVQNAAKRLVDRAKREDDPRTMILVCQATKDGDLAGPNAVRHVVDCVLYFEGQERDPARWLRTRGKNRFGPTPMEKGFEMTPGGLVDLGDKVRRLPTRGKGGGGGGGGGGAGRRRG